MEEAKLLSQLEQTELSARIEKIRAIYEKLMADEDRFCDHFCVHCKPGCGTCCEHFIPDITNLEAEFLAFGLIAQGRDEQVLQMLQDRDPHHPFCPLYNPDDDHHCTVYAWRPLICRLFGATASRDKEGRPVFRKCRWNDGGRDVSTREMEDAPEYVACMGEYGMMLEEAEPGEADTELLPEALPRAIAKLRLVLSLCAPEDH